MNRIIIALTVSALLLLPRAFAEESRTGVSEEPPYNSIASGVGVPFGGIGGNLELRIVPGVRVAAGLGTMVGAGLGWSFGLRYYPVRSFSRVSPRLSVYYGTNSVLKVMNPNATARADFETYNGLTFGVGSEVYFGSRKTHGIDFEVLYVADYDSEIDRLIEQDLIRDRDSDLQVSVGYRIAL